METLQIRFKALKTLYKELNLKIKSNKCELKSEVNEDSINDNENNIKIKSQFSAKCLKQNINQKEITTIGINKVNFGRFLYIIYRTRDFTRIAKIGLFHIFMKTKFNHLILWIE